MKRINTKMLVVLALLVALNLVLGRFCSFFIWSNKIGFGFVPVFVAAHLYGPLAGGMVGALGDLLSAILFPIGPYFPGYTLSAALSGLVLGVFLHKGNSLPRVLGAVAVNQWIISLLLTSFWISFTNLTPYWPMVATRIPQCAIMTAVQLVVLTLLPRLLRGVKGGNRT